MKITSTLGYSMQQNYHSIDGAIKVLHDKQKLKQYMTTNQPLKKIVQEILHTESEIQHYHERSGSTKHRKSKSKKVESNINLATHNQALKQLRKLNDSIHHISINTNT
jgi:hypothetical protein